ncbi:MAG TPA: YebC/PmpR family DNA-binding transcriptional regulator [Nitrospiraceae bacterium]|uniref:Probable transcriptional regulatory protein UU48_C0046G0004 n=1 Tax=Candidatus Uhrbacteria bacterium GW2011_GWF2_41_16 TaxID=1618997 RepID=A0A0G0Y5S4_9BACT|nr:MAG: transcriptional regulator [Candidatus Uhrbacteria bacterium GW2011_GWF2_41_16]OGW52645.1 MAG: transcriptional regulator [Nitrospirae bacterium RIFCSPLOWO2_02_42_7]HAS17604.1 YebC/PmpR family DNA-binding transcriptional regulator [Nitrospiraceae bacterium]HBI23712.1 YebC/PmpR family DNA-binding transcriptional regulator [Nitrospiraceae bacterium]
MSGHSKWATTKHKKMAIDAKRGKVFTKLIKEITIAARIGGGDPNGNPRLRTAIAKAKESNMPSDNIKKAIQRGTGELPGVNYEESIFEGYGPGGAAILISIMTDNKNRTVSEIRHMLSKNGGNMGEAGCVSWMFDKKGYLIVEGGKVDEDSLMNLVLEAGAEDMRKDAGNFEIITAPGDFETVKGAIENAGIAVAFAEITMLPQNYIDLDEKSAEQVLKLMEILEDHEDVQNVYSNFNLQDEVLNKIEK